MSRSDQWRRNSPGYWGFEGESGVKNLCRFVRFLGYKDFQHFGQFQDGCYGDLITFLSDNPGAIEAMIEWIDVYYGEEDDEEEFNEELDEP